MPGKSSALEGPEGPAVSLLLLTGSLHRPRSFAHPSQGSHQTEYKRICLLLVPPSPRQERLVCQYWRNVACHPLSHYVRLFRTSASVGWRGLFTLELSGSFSGPNHFKASLGLSVWGVSLNCVLSEMAGTWCLFLLDIASKRTGCAALSLKELATIDAILSVVCY